MLDKFDAKKVANFGRTFQINATFLLCNFFLNLVNLNQLGWIDIYWQYSSILGEEFALPIKLIAAIIPFFAIFSLARITAIHDTPLKESFFEKGVVKIGYKERLCFLFKSKLFLIKLIVFSIFTFITSWTYAGVAQFVSTDILSWVIIVCFIPLIVLGHTTAIKVWVAQKVIEEEEKRLNANKKKKKRGFLKDVLLVFFAYIIGGIGLMMLLPIFRTFIIVGKRTITLKFIFLVAFILIIPKVVEYIRAYSKRRSFLKRLYRICKEKNYKLSKINYRYRSATGIYKGESFSVYIGDRRFSCKLIGCPKKHLPLFIFKDGNGAFLKITRFLRIELKRTQINFNFSYEAEGKKVLILNPTPKFVYTYFMGKTSEIDNADIIGGYEIYTATAFLNALERDCIDID